ncbi:hypothetical protein C3L33_22179, partial [Rhododendron williamsianum]
MDRRSGFCPWPSDDERKSEVMPLGFEIIIDKPPSVERVAGPADTDQVVVAGLIGEGPPLRGLVNRVVIDSKYEKVTTYAFGRLSGRGRSGLQQLWRRRTRRRLGMRGGGECEHEGLAGGDGEAQLGLPVSGNLDAITLSHITAPRCGVSDTDTSPFMRHYAYFTGRPRWTRNIPMTLTYAFSLQYSITVLNSSAVKTAFQRAFSRWSSVIPVNFTLTDDYVFADIKIGFYGGDHGDGEPFDGVLGVLAHSFSPEIGRLHLDAAETWAVDFESEKSEVAVDLESVALHEIGHVMGLKHTSVREAVMYPSLKPRERKLDLKVDDIKGIQDLYGSNPNFKFGSSNMESYISSNQAVVLRFGLPMWIKLVIVLIWFSCM